MSKNTDEYMREEGALHRLKMAWYTLLTELCLGVMAVAPVAGAWCIWRLIRDML